ncbi:MAG: peptidylprolyl isomerase [Rhodobacteraceae bacterium]|nr:peptidylprolyl isomerase [Paracoccaceae bacterium]
MAEYKDPENTILMELKDGTVVIELLPNIAPNHCARMKELARSGQYDNVCFHRVIDGFMAQTGDVQYGNMENDFDIGMAGRGGSDLPNVAQEFSGIPHDRGTLGAARSQNPDSANSQFFINFNDNHFLNRQYTPNFRMCLMIAVLWAWPVRKAPTARIASSLSCLNQVIF